MLNTGLDELWELLAICLMLTVLLQRWLRLPGWLLQAPWMQEDYRLLPVAVKDHVHARPLWKTAPPIMTMPVQAAILVRLYIPLGRLANRLTDVVLTLKPRPSETP